MIPITSLYIVVFAVESFAIMIDLSMLDHDELAQPYFRSFVTYEIITLMSIVLPSKKTNIDARNCMEDPPTSSGFDVCRVSLTDF
jgi:hypothetical protein